LKAILDMDPGVDDALAILFALKLPNIEIEAITAVSGNVPVQLGSVNALKVLSLAGVEKIPVAAGIGSLIKDLEMNGWRRRIARPRLHGENGLGDAVLPSPKRPLEKSHAVDLILERIKEEPGELTMIPTGPLSNIAAAILKDPESMKKIKEVVLMGGAARVPGNVTPVAEFNIWYDPEAARIVFNSDLPIIMVGLDVTTEVEITSAHLARLAKRKSRVSEFVVEMVGNTMERLKEVGYSGESHVGFYLHDPLAVAVALDRSLVRTERLPVDVETKGELTRGMTVADRRIHRATAERNLIDVCVDVDSRRFMDLFMSCLERY